MHVKPGIEVLGHQHAHVLPATRRVVEKVRLGHGPVADDVLHAHRTQQLVAVGAVLKELLVAAHLVGKLTTRDVTGERTVYQGVIDGRELALEERVRAGVAEKPTVHPEALVKLEDLCAHLGLGGAAAANVGNLGELRGMRGTALPHPAQASALGARGGGATGLLDTRGGRGLCGITGLCRCFGHLSVAGLRGVGGRGVRRSGGLLGCSGTVRSGGLLGCSGTVRSGRLLDRLGSIDDLGRGLVLVHSASRARVALGLLASAVSALHLRRNAQRVDALLPLHGVERLRAHRRSQRYLGFLAILAHDSLDVLVGHNVAPHAHQRARHGRSLVLLRGLQNLAEGLPQIIKIHTFHVGQFSRHAGFLSCGHARMIRQ